MEKCDKCDNCGSVEHVRFRFVTQVYAIEDMPVASYYYDLCVSCAGNLITMDPDGKYTLSIEHHVEIHPRSFEGPIRAADCAGKAQKVRI